MRISRQWFRVCMYVRGTPGKSAESLTVDLFFGRFDHMANEKTKLLRVKFSDLALGQSFYDPVSAEYFIKRTEGLAAMISGIGDGTVPDEFDADDIVGIGQN
jgi:hypothetical protein